MQRIRAASLVEQAASGMQIVTLMICGEAKDLVSLFAVMKWNADSNFNDMW